MGQKQLCSHRKIKEREIKVNNFFPKAVKYKIFPFLYIFRGFLPAARACNLQHDQINIAALYWYIVKSDAIYATVQ